MRVWRICRRAQVITALDGIGGMHVSGRWHFKGRRVVYTASSAALAALEVLVHVDPLTAPSDLRLLAIEVPNDLGFESVDVPALPKNWQTTPAPLELQAIGAAWLEEMRTAALWVPSAIVPAERNLLLNPRHPDMVRVRLNDDQPFSFDSRLV